MLEIFNQDHFDKVQEFAGSMGLLEQLQEQLDYLSHYAYHPDDTDPSHRVEKKCVLGPDFAPHSFGFAILEPDPSQPDGWRYWFNGGLIYQGPDSPADGISPSLTVSLSKRTGWFVHT